jgi:hypothetical protein
MVRTPPNPNRHTAFTSRLFEGQDLSKQVQCWNKKAESDCRLTLMTKLISMNLGFNELMIFNETLRLQIRSETLKRRIAEGKNPESKVVQEAMAFKLRDEQFTNKEAEKLVNGQRMMIKKEFGDNSRKTRRILKMLNTEAQKTREERREKYRMKIMTIKKNNMIDEELKTNKVPPELTEYAHAKVFSKVSYDEIEGPEIEIMTVGDVEMSKEEIMVLRKHPKFALLENLKLEDLELHFELSFGKYRYQIQKELRDKKNEQEKTGIGDEVEEKTAEEMEKQETDEAETRRVFNPMDKSYDARKLRLTDLEINTRVTLPKGLPSNHEAWIEVRREKYAQVCTEYIGKNCSNKGEQEQNLTKDELKGLIKLKKRIKEGDVLVMCTDKSNKFAITDRETYKAMGAVHTARDRKIGRREMIEREKVLNSHASMWNKMLNQGEDHQHGDRIHDSLVTHDQALAVMTLLLKDHKAGNKTRQVVTGNSSNSVGLSITVSMFLEAVASSIEEPYEVNSSEEMMAVIEEVNDKWRERDDSACATDNILVSQGVDNEGMCKPVQTHGGMSQDDQKCDEPSQHENLLGEKRREECVLIVSQCLDTDGGESGRMCAHGGTHETQSMGEMHSPVQTQGRMSQDDQMGDEPSQHDHDEPVPIVSQCLDTDGGECETQSMGEMYSPVQTHGRMSQDDQRCDEPSQHDHDEPVLRVSQCLDTDGGECRRMSAHGGTHETQIMGEMYSPVQTQGRMGQDDLRCDEPSQHDNDEQRWEECALPVSQCSDKDGGECWRMTVHGGTHETQSMGG